VSTNVSVDDLDNKLQKIEKFLNEIAMKTCLMEKKMSYIKQSLIKYCGLEIITIYLYLNERSVII